jgi:hypothetical protein
MLFKCKAISIINHFNECFKQKLQRQGVVFKPVKTIILPFLVTHLLNYSTTNRLFRIFSCIISPSILEPDLDLGLGELELVGELCPLRDGEVLLLAELLLQGVQLLGGEGGAGLPVGLVLPQGAAQRPRGWPEPQVCKWKIYLFIYLFIYFCLHVSHNINTN